MTKESEKKVEEEKTATEVIKVAELINLRKCDMKDDKKKAKIFQIVLFSFQETLKFEQFSSLLKDGKKSASEIIKMEVFRSQVMQFIETQFYSAGFVDKVAVLGNRFSFELKASRRSLMIFEVAPKLQTPFYLLVFELAYINVPSQNIVADKLF